MANLGNPPSLKWCYSVSKWAKIPYIHFNFGRVCPPSQDGVINREKVYSPYANAGNCNVYKADNKRLCSSSYWLSAIICSSNAMK